MSVNMRTSWIAAHVDPVVLLPLSRHAEFRHATRGISRQAMAAVLDYGRVSHIRGAAVHAIGRREIAAMARKGVDLSEHDGLHVVCATDGTVITVYRNRDLRGLRRSMRTRRR